MGKKYTDGNGFLHLEGTPISRVQIAPYLGRQIDVKGMLKDDDGKPLLKPNQIYYVYRSADELFDPDTMKSFEGMPFRIGHQMLGNGGKNVKSVDKAPIDGTFINVRRSKDNPDYLLADIIVYTDRAKRAIANGTRELSIGYRCAYKVDQGEHEGVPYQFRQTNIKANHLALVPHGRAGSSVCVQDEAIVDDDGLVVTCDSLPEEIQIMEEKEKKAHDKLAALLKGSEENVQDCLDYCDLTEEQKKAVKAIKADKGKPEDVPTEDKACKCKGCGKDELPAPTPPPAVEETEKETVKTPEGEGEAKETVKAEPAPTPVDTPAEPAPKEGDEGKATFTQDEMDDACKKAASAARKDALRAKALADLVGEDADPEDTEAQVARKACKKIRGLEQYAEDSRPDGEVLAAIRGHLARKVADGEDAPKVTKKKIVSVTAQDEGLAREPSAFSTAEFNEYLGKH